MNDYEIILSLTTWAGRINDPNLPLVLYRLIAQQTGNHKYKVVLVLSRQEFGDYFQLPDNIEELLKNYPDKFEVLWTYENTRALKKLDPTMEKYPENYIATMDDDELMQPWMVDYLCSEIKNRPNTILGAWCGPYRGVNRVGLCRLYPPHSLADIPTEYFKTYFQYMQDDEWNGIRAKVAGTPMAQMTYNPVISITFGDQSKRFTDVYDMFDFKSAMDKFFADHPEYNK